MIALWLAAQALAGEQYLVEQTTAFEDVAVDGASDEDTNDLVLRWSAKCDRTSAGVIRQTIHFAAVAAGASYTNGLVLIPPAPATATLRVGAQTAVALPPGLSGEWTLFDDFRDAFEGPPAGMVNTTGATVVNGLASEVVLTFDTPEPFGGACPIPEFALSRPGVYVDLDTTIGPNHRPLAGSFSGTWEPPTERTAVSVAYPRFLAWVTDLLDTFCDTECVAPMWFDEPEPGRVLARPDLDLEAPLAAYDTCLDEDPGLACGDPDGVCPPCGVYVLAAGGTRAWSDGTWAESCEAYRYPEAGRSFAGEDATSGTYTIDPLGGDPFRVYCDMDYDGGGWTKVMALGPDGATPMGTTAAVNRDGAWTGTARGTAVGKVSQAEWQSLWDATEFVVRVENPSDGKFLANGAGYLKFTATAGTRFTDWGVSSRPAHYQLACDRTGDGLTDQTLSFDDEVGGDCGHGQYWLWDHESGIQCFGSTTTRMRTNVHFCGTATAQSDGNVTGVHTIYVRGVPARITLDGASRRWDDGTYAASCDAYRYPDAGHLFDGPDATSGTYTIDPLGGSPFQAWCDMEFEGGGWTKVMSYGPSTGTNLGTTARVNANGTWTTSAKGTANGKVSHAEWQALWSGTAFMMRVEDPSDGKFIGGGVGYLKWTTSGTFSAWGTGSRPTNYTLSCDKTGDGVFEQTASYGTATDTCAYGTYWLWDHHPGLQCYGSTSTYLRTNIHFCGTLDASSGGGVTGVHHIYVRD